MGVLLTVVLIVIIIAFMGVVGTEGLWNSLLMFFNVLFAAILATNLFEPAATWLDSKEPTFSYVWDILMLWGLFAFFALLFRLGTERVSKVKVQFMRPVDLAGGMLISAWTGWIMVSFTLMSLHVAPLARNSFGGAFQPEPESKMFFSLAPDRKWLALMNRLSRGGFAAEASPEVPDSPRFDPRSEFILKYATRRAIYETTPELRVRREWGTDVVDEAIENREQP